MTNTSKLCQVDKIEIKSYMGVLKAHFIKVDAVIIYDVFGFLDDPDTAGFGTLDDIDIGGRFENS